MSFVVIFDMDGLMLDTERMARKAWKQALEDLGYAIDDSIYLQIVGRTVRDAEMILGKVYGPAFPFQPVYQLRQDYYDADIQENGVPVKPGLIELLDYLEAQGIRRAVASSTHRAFANIKLSRAGILDRFEVIVCGDEVSNGKPAPDLFLRAAELMNVSPETCIVLEDSEAGIRAAYAAGMFPVMIPDLKQPTPDLAMLAYRILPSLHEVIPMLAEFQEKGLPSVSERLP